MNTRKAHGTTLVAVKTKTHIALATDCLVSAGDYPVSHTISIKLHKLAPQLYMAITGSVAVAETMITLLQELIAENPTLDWQVVFRGFYMTLRAWVEKESDPIHKGIAKSLLFKDAADAAGLIIHPTGIYRVFSTGEFDEIEQPVVGDGCGGDFAEGAARAFLKTKPTWSASKIAKESVKIAAQSTVFANDVAKVVTVRRAK